MVGLSLFAVYSGAYLDLDPPTLLLLVTVAILYTILGMGTLPDFEESLELDFDVGVDAVQTQLC